MTYYTKTKKSISYCTMIDVMIIYITHTHTHTHTLNNDIIHTHNTVHTDRTMIHMYT